MIRFDSNYGVKFFRCWIRSKFVWIDLKIHDSIDSKGEKQFEKFNKNQFEIRSIRLHFYFNDCQINGCSFFSSRRIQGGSSDSSTQFFSNEVIWPGMRIFSIIEHQQGKGNLLLFRGQNSSLLADDGTTVLSAVNGKTIRIAFFKAATASYNCFNFRVSQSSALPAAFMLLYLQTKLRLNADRRVNFS